MLKEYHPFDSFIPYKCRYLILGSFPGKEFTQEENNILSYDSWYYGTKSNLFWKLISDIYNVILITIDNKTNLLNTLKIGISDIIQSCKRKNNNNSDYNLIDIDYKKDEIINILLSNPIEKVYFTSIFVERNFSKNIIPINNTFIQIANKTIEAYTLFSPSNAANRRRGKPTLTYDMRKAQYKFLLPVLNNYS